MADCPEGHICANEPLHAQAKIISQRMQIERLQIQESYLEERVYLALADALTAAGYPDEAGRALVRMAFAEGRSDFEAAERE